MELVVKVEALCALLTLWLGVVGVNLAFEAVEKAGIALLACLDRVVVVLRGTLAFARLVL